MNPGKRCLPSHVVQSQTFVFEMECLVTCEMTLSRQGLQLFCSNRAELERVEANYVG